MPRPGPRPYECVRRAWHSDRHQPIRGTLIQEIFRMANEVHCAGTRKNKEWQQKLPFVVFKAEEIMYCKANSEAEYLDLETAWERANDAIDTIIRRVEGEESGDLLKPCVEAALNLGCIPRRASRSQRHNSPRCYLSSGTQESAETSKITPVAPDGKLRPQRQGVPFHLHLPVPSASNLQSSNQQFVSWSPPLEAQVAGSGGLLGARVVASTQELRESIPTSIHECNLPSMETLNSNQGNHMKSSFEACTWSITGRSFPLYYSENHPTNANPQAPLHSSASLDCSHPGACSSLGWLMREGEKDCLQQDSLPNSHHNLPCQSVGTFNSDKDKDKYPFQDSTRPSVGCVQSLHNSEVFLCNKSQFFINSSSRLKCTSSLSHPCLKEAEIGFLHNFLDSRNFGGPSIGTQNLGNLYGGLPDLECDLSLRLGPPTGSCLGDEMTCFHEVEDVDSSSSNSSYENDSGLFS